VLIAKAEGNCFIVGVSKDLDMRLSVCGLGNLDFKERKQNFKMRWD